VGGEGPPPLGANDPPVGGDDPGPDAGPSPPDAGPPPPDAGPLSGAAAPCEGDPDCASGQCDQDAPGGFCVVGCGQGCTLSTLCSEQRDARGACHEICARAQDCRDGWRCLDGLCQVDCAHAGCAGGLRCDDSGACVPDCRPEPEVCNGVDDDCDGQIDEGVLNACGRCGPTPADACNGLDDDCDGRTDEDAACPAGQLCEDGRCVGEPPPQGSPVGGPCRNANDCQAGRCLDEANDGFPDGICVTDCDGLFEQCDVGALCVNFGEESVCFPTCNPGACREGWRCQPEEPFVCVPHCSATGCNGVGECDQRTGSCDYGPSTRVAIEQIVVAPAKNDGAVWDGPAGLVAQAVIDNFIAALGGDDPFNEVVGFFASALVRELEQPDTEGTAALVSEIYLANERALPEQSNTFTPRWADVAWNGLDLHRDLRIRLQLVDKDILDDDRMGTIDLHVSDLLDAYATGGSYPIRVDDQDVGQVIFVVVRVEDAEP
jgi:hypothetical protein